MTPHDSQSPSVVYHSYGYRRWGVALVVLLSLAIPPSGLFGCRSTVDSHTTLLVGAAISLQPVLDTAVARFVSRGGEIEITVSYAGSGAIRRQVEFGAPIDLYLSAAPDHIDSLEAQDLTLPGSRTALASNTLVLIMSIQHAPIAEMTDLRLGGISRIAIGQPDIVPAGRYAYQVLDRTGELSDLQEKLVYTKDVQQVLVYVQAGIVDAGFVYASNVLASSPVRVIQIIPDSLHAPIVYEGIVTRRSENAGAAREFLAYLVSDSVQTLFKAHGFLPARE